MYAFALEHTYQANHSCLCYNYVTIILQSIYCWSKTFGCLCKDFSSETTFWACFCRCGMVDPSCWRWWGISLLLLCHCYCFLHDTPGNCCRHTCVVPTHTHAHTSDTYIHMHTHVCMHAHTCACTQVQVVLHTHRSHM